jgi:hypothetical protein
MNNSIDFSSKNYSGPYSMPRTWEDVSYKSMLVGSSKEYQLLETYDINRNPIMTIHTDGRITVSETAKPTETAKLVLDAMQGMLLASTTFQWNKAIDAAIESLGDLRILREDGRWQHEVLQELKK